MQTIKNKMSAIISTACEHPWITLMLSTTLLWATTAKSWSLKMTNWGLDQGVKVKTTIFGEESVPIPPTCTLDSIYIYKEDGNQFSLVKLIKVNVNMRDSDITPWQLISTLWSLTNQATLAHIHWTYGTMKLTLPVKLNALNPNASWPPYDLEYLDTSPLVKINLLAYSEYQEPLGPCGPLGDYYTTTDYIITPDMIRLYISDQPMAVKRRTIFGHLETVEIKHDEPIRFN
jgi:hypothetical protein